MYVTHTLVIGAGGTGGQLIPSLARLLEYHPNATGVVKIADGDVFEEKNQTRQLCGPDQLGRNKAEVLAEQCQAMGLYTVNAIPEFLDKPALRRLLLKGSLPMVISTVDNDATRKAVIDVLGERERDWIHCTTGNSSIEQDGRITTSTHWHGVLDGKPFGLSPALLFDNIANPSDAIPAHGTCANHAPSAPQLISANALSATMTLLVIQNLLDGTLPPQSNSLFGNGRSFKFAFS